jgi:hypothetical protein
MGKDVKLLGTTWGYMGTIFKKPFGKAYGMNIRNTCWARMGIVGIT